MQEEHSWMASDDPDDASGMACFCAAGTVISMPMYKFIDFHMICDLLRKVHDQGVRRGFNMALTTIEQAEGQLP